MLSPKFFGFIRVKTKLSSQSNHLFQSKLPTTVFSDVMIGHVYCHGDVMGQEVTSVKKGQNSR